MTAYMTSSPQVMNGFVMCPCAIMASGRRACMCGIGTGDGWESWEAMRAVRIMIHDDGEG